MTSKKTPRSWCVTCRYENKQPFLFGNVLADDYDDALAKLTVLWEERVPFPPPKEFVPIPGQLIFVGDLNAD